MATTHLKTLRAVKFALVAFMCLAATAYAATITELQRAADCIAALNIASSSFQVIGEYNREQTMRSFAEIEFNRFYDLLADYKSQNANINESRIGRMPNRALRKYYSMNEQAQIKYSTEVIRANNCGFKG